MTADGIRDVADTWPGVGRNRAVGLSTFHALCFCYFCFVCDFFSVEIQRQTKRASQEACREALAAGKSVEEVKLMAETWFPKTTEKLLCPVFDSTGGLPYCKEQKIIIIKTLLSGHLRQL